MIQKPQAKGFSLKLRTVSCSSPKKASIVNIFINYKQK